MRNMIIIAGLISLTPAAFMYAFFQQTTAERAKVQAELNARAAIEARAIADNIAELAKEEAMHANRCLDETLKLRDSLRNCKGR